MATPVRYPSGVVTRPASHPFGRYYAPDPFQWIVLEDDFVQYAASNYTITAATGTAVLTAGEGGVLLLSTTAVDNDFVVVQLPQAPFVLRPAKRAIFSCRVTSNTWADATATSPAIVVGLSLTDTTPITDGGLTTSVTDGLYFFKPSASAGIRLDVENGDAITSSAALSTAVNAVFQELAFIWDGVATISAYINGVRVFDQTTITNIPTTADPLNLLIAIKAGTGAIQTLSVDNVFVGFER